MRYFLYNRFITVLMILFFPQHRAIFRKRPSNVKYTLVFRAAKTQRYIASVLHVPPVNQHIQKRKYLRRVLRSGAARTFTRQFFKRKAAVTPDILIGKLTPHAPQNFQHPRLIFRLQRFAANERKSADIAF